jgi:NADPH:quinone reductase-like Zn-dependent oxidoreductase
MRAAIIHERGGSPVVGGFAEPQVADGLTAIQVIAGGIGPTDLMRSAGFFGPMPYPYVPGGEGIGRLADGSRVYFGHSAAPFGAWAERTAVPGEEVWPLPDDIDDGLALALGISGTGALIPLQEARIQPGETVLVLGATGSLGQIALQLARILGAGRIVGAARDEAALGRLRQAGVADATARLGTGDDPGRLKAEAGAGYDVVLDCIYGPPAEAAMRATRPGARMMSIGIQAGPTVTLSLRDLVFRSHVGVGTGQRPVAERRAAFEQLIDYGRSGRIKVEVSAFSLDEAAAAWAAQTKGAHAKVMVRPGG